MDKHVVDGILVVVVLEGHGLAGDVCSRMRVARGGE